MPGELTQADVDLRNTAFWDELCGSSLARAHGIDGTEPDALERFDRAYLDLYPYLLSYVDRFDLADKRVLEIGLGFGTLGEQLARRCREYHAIDIASAPVELMQLRLRRIGIDPAERVGQASALEIPRPSASFDLVYSIGTLHHTGDLARAISEVHRVLRPGGTAVVMIYHRHSFRRLAHLARSRLRADESRRHRLAASYDANAAGDLAPHTDFASRRQARRLFDRFDAVRIDVRNFDSVTVGRRVLVDRQRLLGTLDRVLGLDLYVVARK